MLGLAIFLVEENVFSVKLESKRNSITKTESPPNNIVGGN